MSKCQDCGKEMTAAKSCSTKFKTIRIGKKMYPRITSSPFWDSEPNGKDRCHDCGIIIGDGNIHHLGCDMEICPKCNGQLISCDCDKN